MLVRLLPEQVESNWHIVAPMVAESLPPTVRRSMHSLTNVLVAVLLEKAQGWAYINRDQVWQAFLLTTFYTDPIMNTNHLLVYSAYAIKTTTEDMWRNSIRTLRKYCESRGLYSVLAFTSNPALARLVTKLGGKAENILLELDIKEV